MDASPSSVAAANASAAPSNAASVASGTAHTFIHTSGPTTSLFRLTPSAWQLRRTLPADRRSARWPISIATAARVASKGRDAAASGSGDAASAVHD